MLDVTDEAFERRGVWPRHARRRHHAGAHLSNHPLPQFGGLRHVGEIRVFERQLTSLRAVVVTGDAIRLQCRGGAGGRGRRRCSRALRRTGGAGKNDGEYKRSGGEAHHRAGSDPMRNLQNDPNSIGSYSLAEIRRHYLLRKRPTMSPAVLLMRNAISRPSARVSVSESGPDRTAASPIPEISMWPSTVGAVSAGLSCCGRSSLTQNDRRYRVALSV